jgi:hypothetical protein
VDPKDPSKGRVGVDLSPALSVPKTRFTDEWVNQEVGNPLLAEMFCNQLQRRFEGNYTTPTSAYTPKKRKIIISHTELPRRSSFFGSPLATVTSGASSLLVALGSEHNKNDETGSDEEEIEEAIETLFCDIEENGGWGAPCSN